MHKGFYQTFWLTLRASVFQAVSQAASQCGSACTQLTVVGHSLGGALSTLASVELVDQFPQLSGWTAISRLCHPSDLGSS